MATQITALPEPPSRSDASTFAARGDAFLGALPTFQAEANTQAAETWAAYSAVLSNTAAAIAKGTSTTSLTIGTGSKAFTTQASKGFVAGQMVIASSAANRSNWMWGIVVSYASTTLTLNVIQVGGTGTLADWDLLIATVPGSVLVTDFVASGTWTKAPTTQAVYIMCLGAGGGGGGVSATASRGASGGGGGGDCSEMWYMASELSGTETVTIGAGGAGGAPGASGAAGGSTTFGTNKVKAAGGGGGGGVGSSGTGGAGGGGGGGASGTGVQATAINSGSFTKGGDGGLSAPLSMAVTNANTSGLAGTDASGHKGAAGGNGVASGSTVAGVGGAADWGGAGGGGGGSATVSSFGGNGGVSVMGGHGGGGGGTGSGGNGGGGAGVSRNPVLAVAVAAGGAAGANANGSDGSIACGGGGCITTAAVARTGGAGGRGHCRVIEFGF